MDKREFKKIIEEVRNNNPYPNHLKIGSSEEKRFWDFGKMVWINCCDKFSELLEDLN